MCYHITNVFDSWYFMKKGLLSGMKKRILRLINYIFVIAILFGGMCLDKVEAYSSDMFADDVTAGFVSVNSENNRLSSDYKNSTGFYSSYDDCKVFATPQPSINDSRPCTSQMLGNPNSNISECASIRTGVRYTAKINALIMSDCSDGISNCEHYFTYNKSMENFFSIQTIVVDYIHNTDGEK